MIRAKARLSSAVLPLLAAACSTAGQYPSLQLRDFERPSGNASPVAGETQAPLPPPPPPSADLVTRLDGLVAVARAADRQFAGNRAAAERAVAAAGAKGSDSWSSASIALARLESSRSQAMVALADLDTLYVDARSGKDTQDTPSTKAIATARDQVQGWIAAQDKVLESLSARLRT